MIVKLYSNPIKIGWLGWIEANGRCLAFINLKGQVIWDW